MIARLERAGGFVGDEQAADRQAVRESFRERDRVRPHIRLLVREERARSTDAGLHLVEDEQRAVFVGEASCCSVGPCASSGTTSLAQDRLEQDAAGVLRDCSRERSFVVRRVNVTGSSGSKAARFAG